MSLDENFPGPGEIVDAKDLDYDMLDYFNRTNKVLSIDTKSKKGIKGSVGKMYNDLVFNGDSIAKKDIVRVKILEGTYNNDREIAIYDGEDGLTYIEKRGKGYYGYNDEFDFEAENKAELEKKLKSWKYKLISGSIDESTEVNEGQFSWMTHDTEKQIGSEKQNTITVYMFSDKGERWEEKRYEGYGEFGGKDYYELLAQMNGVENADRQDGIDIAFDKKKVKGKVLFPALVQDPKFNWKRHDFTQEAEHDPNQSWYKERSRGFY
jgi:hypothetical protein